MRKKQFGCELELEADILSLSLSLSNPLPLATASDNGDGESFDAVPLANRRIGTLSAVMLIANR